MQAFLKLNDTDDNGVSLKSKLQQVKKTLGVLPKEYNTINIPLKLRYLWNIYFELKQSAPDNGISYSCIYYYMTVNNIELEKWEIDIIMSMDITCKEFYRKKRIDKAKRGT